MEKRKRSIRSRILSILLAICMVIPELLSPLTVQAAKETANVSAEGFIFAIEDYSTGEGQYILEPTRVETGYDGTKSQDTHVMLNKALAAAGIEGIKVEKGPQLDWWIEYILSIGELVTDTSSFDSSSGDLTSATRWEVSFANEFGTDVFVGKKFKYDSAHKNSVIRAMYTVDNGTDIGATDRGSHQMSVNKDELLRTIADARALGREDLTAAIADAEAVALQKDADQNTTDAKAAELFEIMTAPPIPEGETEQAIPDAAAGEGFIFSIEDYSTGEGRYILDPVRVETGYDGTKSQDTHVILNRALAAAGVEGITAEKGPQLDWWIEYILSIGELVTDTSSFDSSSGDLTSATRWEISFANEFGTDVFVGKKFKYDSAHKNSVIRAMYTVDNGTDIGATDRGSHQMSVNKDELLRTIADARALQSADLKEIIDRAKTTALGNDGQETVDAMTAELKEAMESANPEPETPSIESVKIQGSPEREVEAGKTIQFSATKTPAEAVEEITWSVDQQELAEIDGVTGKFTAKKPGAVIVTATAGDVSATVKVTITAPAKNITIQHDGQEAAEITIVKGLAAQLTAVVEPADSTDAVSWTSAEPKVAEVDQNGKVTAKAVGTTTVTAKAGTKSAQIQVKVVEIPVTGITLDQKNVTLQEEDSVTVKATVEPEGATEAVVWTSKNPEIAKVENGKITGIEIGKTTVTATAGKFSASVEVEVVAGPYVYFEYADGREAQKLDKKTNSFTLSTIDAGTFKMGNVEGEVTFDCEQDVTDVDGYHTTEYIIKGNGRFDPYSTGVVNNAKAIYNGKEKTFKINVISSGITEIRTKVNGNLVTNEDPFAVVGAVSGQQITVEGRKSADEEFVPIPQEAVSYLSESGMRAYVTRDGKLTVTNGRTVITALMEENFDVKAEFTAMVGELPPTGMEVVVPEEFYIDKWNALGGYYVGCQPYEGYKIFFTPSNTTNKGVTWEALTPDIAYHMVEFTNGIIPKRAGVARFKVTSSGNPALSQEVSIEFKYKNPLQSVTGKKEYKLGVNQVTDLDLHFTPGNATEQRFDWSFDKEGIVKIEEKVLTDISGTSAKWFEHKMLGLKDGTVTVTGTPMDTTAGCKPITFTVKVGKGGSDLPTEVDVMPSLNHGLSYLEKQEKSAYNNEWTIMTLLRSGKTLTAKEKEDYIASAKAKVESGRGLKHTDYARIIFTLTAMGEDPETVLGVNVIEKMCCKSLNNTTSNMAIWTLIALDTHDYKIPAASEYTRDSLIAEILTYQAEDGSFSLNKGDKTGSIDMTAMAMQALADYRNKPEVQKAFNDADAYLKKQLTMNAGFVAEGGENACSSAQVITALTEAGIDPLDPKNGYVIAGNNIVSRMMKFESGEGFALHEGFQPDLMTTEQVTFALEAYRRFKAGENSLYDMNDVKLNIPEKPKKATVTFSVERFTIGQGYLVEPVTVEVMEGDPVVSVIKKVLGADRLDLNSGDNYLATIKDADLGTDKVVVPQYITDMSNGSVTTESVREYGNEDYDPGTLGEFSYHYQSGWFYFLNNEDPGIGIGQQTVKDGDVIRLQFTLYGLGKDLTGKGYGETEATVLIESKDSITKLMAQVNGSEEKIKNNVAVKAAYADAVKAVSAMITSKEDLVKAEEALAKAVKDAENAKPVTGWAKDGNYDIYIKADGTKATSEFLNIDGKRYYFDAASHKYATPGFKAVGTIWYYFNTDGSVVKGFKAVGSVWYYFNNNGEMLKGWQQVDGYWYYFNGSGAMHKGWLKSGSNWFYFNGSGHMMTGWQAVSGKWYYFYTSGRMLMGWQKIDGHWYYLKSSGEMTKGWLKDGSNWFYFNGSGHMMTGWQAVSGKWYYFYDSGRMITGWQKIDGYWYYLKSSGEMTKGWLKDGRNWFYFNGSGHMLTGKQKIDGKWYTFRASGAMER